MKTIDECKDEVAKKRGYKNYKDLFCDAPHLGSDWDKFTNEVSELFASQFQQPPTASEWDILFRKVSVKERLPKDEYPVHLIIKDDRGVEYYDVANYEDGEFSDIKEEHEVIYWLEKLSSQPIKCAELPSEKSIEELRELHSKLYNLIGDENTEVDDWIDASEDLLPTLCDAISNVLSIIAKKEEEIAEQKQLSKKYYDECDDLIKEVSKLKFSKEEEKKVEAIKFLESIRDYERESGQRICFDERTSEELYEEFFKQQNHNGK